MDAISLLSGGKDSTFALYIALNQGINVKRTITILPQKDSMMYHAIEPHMARVISSSIGIENDIYGLSDNPKDLEIVLKNYDEKIVISGAIASDYQKTRIDRICENLNKIHYTPLWHKDQFLLLREILNAGFRFIFVGVFAEGLDRSFIGKEFDENMLSKLRSLYAKYKINPSGEGGEYETLVIDAPIMKERIKIKNYDIIWKGESGYMDIKRYVLRKK